MAFRLNHKQSQAICAHFGAPFYHKVTQALATYGELWKLDNYQLVDYFSVNCIFFCRSNHMEKPC